MKRSTSASRRPLERGQFSWVSLVLLLAVVAGGYLAWVWLPIKSTEYDVRQLVRDHMNQAVKNRNDAQLVERMCNRIQALGSEETVDQRGRRKRVPIVDLRPDEVTWERNVDVKPNTLHVSFEYTRQVVYPWIDRVDEAVFTVEFTQDLEVPRW